MGLMVGANAATAGAAYGLPFFMFRTWSFAESTLHAR